MAHWQPSCRRNCERPRPPPNPQLHRPRLPDPVTTYCLTSLYQPAEGAKFDADLFRSQHVPLLKNAYGSSVDRIELRVPAPPPPGATAPPQKFIATTNIWFHEVGEFLNKNNAAAKDITASLMQVTNAPLVGQVDQVLLVWGADRTSIPVDSLCHSVYFPAREGATFDTKYFAETFYPKLAELYGTAAIRRLELTSGVSTGGKAAAVVSSAHIYILDETAYDEGTKKAAELFGEAKTHTNIVPVDTLTRLHAAG